MPDYRLIVLVDIAADTLDQAYCKLREAIHADLVDVGYETSDEFYVDGELGKPDELQEAAMQVFNAEDDNEVYGFEAYRKFVTAE